MQVLGVSLHSFPGAPHTGISIICPDEKVVLLTRVDSDQGDWAKRNPRKLEYDCPPTPKPVEEAKPAQMVLGPPSSILESILGMFNLIIPYEGHSNSILRASKSIFRLVGVKSTVLIIIDENSNNNNHNNA